MATLDTIPPDTVIVATEEGLWCEDHRLGQMPIVQPEALVAANSRAVIVAPHPDDEMLGCAGLMMHLSRLGGEILLIAVSDGEKSHGSESALSAARLSQLRPAETIAALARLGFGGITDADIAIMRTRLPDGGVTLHRAELQDMLCAQLRPDDTVLTTWRLDGHPDHEAAGYASMEAARIVGCRLIEIPIWMWHWRTPDHAAIPWQRARKLMLNDDMQTRKKAALQCYRSQLEPDLSTGKAPIVPPEVLAHFHRPFEIYFV
jgi:LmbE family N-acetylglucosaminyl deacetylase